MAAAALVIDDSVVPIVAILSVFIGAPLSVAYARILWRRASDDRTRAPLVDSDTAQRLIQIQQSIDTIAIEVERLSEGQRFVTKVLAQPSAAAPDAVKRVSS